MTERPDLPEFLRSIRLEGLRPREWLAVGPGYGREELKAVIFAQGRALTASAMTRAEDLALRLVTAARGPSRGGLLSGLARQEGLRKLLAKPAVVARMPELRRLKRQTGFYRKLDRALQSGRLAFAHPEELGALEARLQARGGRSPVRDELKLLADYYEAWLAGLEAWDGPGILAEAAALLERRGWPDALARPDRIVVLSAQGPESREAAFWEAVAAHVPVERRGPADFTPAGDGAPTHAPDWQRWHTLDDAAEGLADALVAEAAAGAEWREQVVLIPDQPAVRRALVRALRGRGIPVADPRDPTRLRTDELVKWALLPLEVVARGFERRAVVGWLRAYRPRSELPEWIREIHARGIRQGLGAYAGGRLAAVHSFLGELQHTMGGKRRCAELGASYLRWLREAVGEDADRMWIVRFLESEWQAFVDDMIRTEQGDRRAPALYWLERLQTRLEEAAPPVERVKPEQGVYVHRLGQAPIERGTRLTLFGLPAGWIAGDGAGDYWFSARERETLAGEFAVRSNPRIGEERRALLGAWIASSRSVRLLDAEYDWDGRERESLFPALRQLGLAEADRPVEEQVRPRGAHARFVPSFGADRVAPPARVELETAPPGARIEISATALDQFSQCGFVGLAGSRWRLYDAREPGTDPWPEVRGDLLHRAIKRLLDARTEDGTFTLEPEAALDQAWRERRPEGLLAGERLAGYVRQRLVDLLRVFLAREREYFERARTRVIAKDDRRFRLELEDCVVVGQPDRVDEHPAGVFIMDYKSGGNLPGGRDMVELGYRLQLPFYALAASRELGRPAIGVQFIELTRKGGRSKGIFFKAWNGKEPGKLTKTTANSSSLVPHSPEETWARCEEQLRAHARRYRAAVFEAAPKRAGDCADCRLGDLCGVRRRNPTAGEAVEEGGE